MLRSRTRGGRELSCRTNEQRRFGIGRFSARDMELRLINPKSRTLRYLAVENQR